MRALITWTALALVLSSGFIHIVRADEIHDAAKDGDAKRIAELVAKDPKSIDARDDGGLTALHFAAGRSLDVAALLVDKGADVNAKTKNGSTPLYIAARFGRRDIAALLIKHKADVNAAGEGGSPLSPAAYRGGRGMVQLLLAHGADVKITDATGATPLHGAASFNAAESARLLLAAKANPNAQDKAGRTPLHSALEIASGNSIGGVAVVKLLIEAKANLNVKNKAGRTPLALAVEKKATAVADLLRAAGAKE